MATADLTAFRDRVVRSVADTFEDDYHDYREAVLTDGSPDDRRKLVELQIRLTGLELDKHLDPLAGKTIVVINNVNGFTQISAAPAPLIVENSPVLAPPVALAPPVVDVNSLLEGLDSELGAMS